MEGTKACPLVLSTPGCRSRVQSLLLVGLASDQPFFCRLELWATKMEYRPVSYLGCIPGDKDIKLAVSELVEELHSLDLESWVDEQKMEGHVPAVSFAVGVIGSVGPVEAVECVAQLDFPTADVKKHGRLGAIEPLVILEACSALFLCELVGARVLAYRSCNCPTQTERTDHKVKQTSRSAYKDGQKTNSTFSQEKR